MVITTPILQTRMTVTEALADLKTCQARITKKREAVMRYVSRDERLKDPLEGQGGSREFIRRERQAIADLEERVVKIRTAIQRVNLATELTVNGTTRTLAAWLNWRREVVNPHKGFLAQLAQAVTAVRQNAVRQGMTVSDKDSGVAANVVICLDEQALAAEIERVEDTLGQLDGKLSLLNATTTVNLD